jgi:hypothetical protein
MTTRGRKHKPGRITFVGAGPGDPGLLTTRARTVLTHAALVFTDPDVPEAVLALVGSELPPASGPEEAAKPGDASGDPVDAPFVDHNHNFQWLDNLSVIHGKHSFKFGGEIRRERVNEDGNIYNRGNIDYGSATATQNPASAAGTGFGFADYMLGKPGIFNWAGEPYYVA